MDRGYAIRARWVRATLLLLIAATAFAQPPRGSREERALRKLEPIYLRLGERRLVDRRLVERIRCERGVLTVRLFGRSALVECGQGLRWSSPSQR
jgi:hypothetical protein